MLPSRIQYYRRIFRAYLFRSDSQLSFWHDHPSVNARACAHQIGEYYMPFDEKADYSGPYDDDGIPLLDYHGNIGRQYNPIAVAQWGLGNYNLFCRTTDADRRRKFLFAADWLRRNLQPNSSGIWVWNHDFDWQYRTPLRAPWYSGLAQGQGISLLLRAHRETRDDAWLDSARRAFGAFAQSAQRGGVTFTDAQGDIWFEEYIVSPPTHILNGFIWAAWGVFDYWLATQDSQVLALFNAAVRTLRNNLKRYDVGYWSLYEQSGTRLPMLASRFYHRLHIVQLRIMYQLTGDPILSEYADRWDSYGRSRANCTRAFFLKTAFKLAYY